MVGVQVAHRLHQATVEKQGTFVRRELAGPAVSCLIQPCPASKNASAPTNSSTAGAGSTLVVGISWTAKPGCEKTAIPK
jgi:hypothetical protein